VAADFLKDFPTLENVLIESWEEGAGVGNPLTSALPPRKYGPPRPVAGRSIRCANSSCRRGGFDFLLDIAGMIHEKLTTKEFVRVCPGDEGTPKRPRSGRGCANILHYRLTLKQKP
jgi:hypothetical protein